MSGAPTTPALLVRGGFLHTADDNDSVYSDGSVLAVDDMVVAAGETSRVLAVANALDPSVRLGLVTIEAGGALILPGFVNPHWHDMFAARGGFVAGLGGPRDADDRPGFLSGGGDMHRISGMFDRFRRMIDDLRPDEAAAIARYAMWTQMVSGVTTLGDMGSLNHPGALADAARALGIRASISTWAGDMVCLPGETGPTRTADTDQQLREIEELLAACAADPTGRIQARLSVVYLTNMSDELGEGLAAITNRDGSTFATHVGAQRNENAFIQSYFGVTPIQRLDKLGLLTERTMAVHCAFADPEDRRLLIDRKVHLNHSPAKYGGSGEATMTGSSMLHDRVRAGADVSLSTDGTALPIGGMAENMRAAWQQHNEMAADNTAVRPSRVLAMATRLAARGLGRAEQTGSLEPGKQADLVLVPRDAWWYQLNPRPLEAFLALGGSSDIGTVIVGGQVLVRDGHAVGLDETGLAEAYAQAVASFTERQAGFTGRPTSGGR